MLFNRRPHEVLVPAIGASACCIARRWRQSCRDSIEASTARLNSWPYGLPLLGDNIDDIKREMRAVLIGRGVMRNSKSIEK